MKNVWGIAANEVSEQAHILRGVTIKIYISERSELVEIFMINLQDNQIAIKYGSSTFDLYLYKSNGRLFTK